MTACATRVLDLATPVRSYDDWIWTAGSDHNSRGNILKTLLSVKSTTRARCRSAVRGAIALALNIVAVSGASAATHISGDIEQDRAGRWTATPTATPVAVALIVALIFAICTGCMIGATRGHDVSRKGNGDIRSTCCAQSNAGGRSHEARAPQPTADRNTRHRTRRGERTSKCVARVGR